jgi:hypothetical protein
MVILAAIIIILTPVVAGITRPTIVETIMLEQAETLLSAIKFSNQERIPISLKLTQN